MYFDDVASIDELKAKHRTLAKQLHPDLGGNPARFDAMQQEYKSLLDVARYRPEIFQMQRELSAERAKAQRKPKPQPKPKAKPQPQPNGFEAAVAPRSESRREPPSTLSRAARAAIDVFLNDLFPRE